MIVFLLFSIWLVLFGEREKNSLSLERMSKRQKISHDKHHLVDNLTSLIQSRRKVLVQTFQDKWDIIIENHKKRWPSGYKEDEEDSDLFEEDEEDEKDVEEISSSSEEEESDEAEIIPKTNEGQDTNHHMQWTIYNEKIRMVKHHLSLILAPPPLIVDIIEEYVWDEADF